MNLEDPRLDTSGRACYTPWVKLFPKLLLMSAGLAVLPLALNSAVVAWRAEGLKARMAERSKLTADASVELYHGALAGGVRGRQAEVVSAEARRLEELLETASQGVQLATAIAEDALREKPSTGADDRRRLARVDAVLRFLQRKHDWIGSVYVAHEDGFKLAAPTGAAAAFDLGRLKALKKGRISWSAARGGPAGGNPLLTCAMPIYRDGRPVAVAAMDVRLDTLVENAFKSDLPFESAVLVDHEKRIIAAADYASQKVVVYGGLERPTFDRFEDGSLGRFYDSIAENDGGRFGSVSVQTKSGLDYVYYAKVDVRAGDEDSVRWRYLLRISGDSSSRGKAKISDDMQAMNAELAQSIDAEARTLRRQLAFAGLLVLLAALAAAAAASRAASRPLVEMSKAVGEIGKGDFSQRVPVRSRDELGEVAGAINEMAKGLEEGAFIKSTFKRYVSASVVDEILKDPAKIRLGGERREMTVFFSDIAGFSTLAEKLEPEKLVELINEYLSEMTDLIFAHRGTLDKYEGDAIMAFWNAPIAQPDHALRACRAALDNIAALRRLQASWAERGLTGFDIRIGINTGPMIVGNMGSPSRLEYTVLGDAVNIGARLEQENKNFGTKIMISDSTLTAAGRENLEVRELGEVTVKGRQQTVKVYELLGMRGAPPRGAS